MSAGAINILRTAAKDWREARDEALLAADKALAAQREAERQAEHCEDIAASFDRCVAMLETEPAAQPVGALDAPLPTAEPGSSEAPVSGLATDAASEDHLIPAQVESHTESTASDLPQSLLESPPPCGSDEADPSPDGAGCDVHCAASESHGELAVRSGEGTNSTEALPGSTGRPVSFSATSLLSVPGAEPGWKAHHEAKKRLAEAAE